MKSRLWLQEENRLVALKKVHSEWSVGVTTEAMRWGVEKRKAAPGGTAFSISNGAGEAIRTPDPNLGKVMLYP
jgi:hypothetical protein